VLFIAIGAVEWLTMARIVRSQVQSLKRMEFVEAARSLGLSHGRSSSATSCQSPRAGDRLHDAHHPRRDAGWRRS
jgi:hypothetical protein